MAANGQLVVRLFSPFESADLLKKNAATTLRSSPIDPKDEKFGLYVPTKQPKHGFGLIVWVSPLDSAGIPPGWPEILEERGVIFVTAARSGNYTSPIGRRVPLALTAAANVLRNYPVDPDRIWIAGFSGGARIAERIALAYPDVFSGAILDGSSDKLGSAGLPLPPRKNLERLLGRMSIVISTGGADEFNTRDVKRLESSLKSHCFDRLSVEVRRGEGHVILNGQSLAKAMEFLDRPREEQSANDRQCIEKLYSKVDADLARAGELVKRGGREARTALRTIDRRYGWLAAPLSLQLRERLKD